jgi:predicted dehydrogenase
MPTKSPVLSRRRLLAASAGAAAFAIVPRHVLGGEQVPPSERVNIAIIGSGGQGRVNAQALLAEDQAQIVAVCDVAEETDLEPFYYRGKGGWGPLKALVEQTYAPRSPGFVCRNYRDFRELLDKEKGLDAVLVATPDHNHAWVSIAAMLAGKHVYCEKPLAHNIREVRLVAEVAARTRVATQMGNHGHSKDALRQTCEWVWDGAIGAVREVHGWSFSPRQGSEGNTWVSHLGRPAPGGPVPANLDWDLWLGVRPDRPYSDEYAPYNWRGWWSFGSGALGDLGCHHLDPAIIALKLESPLTIEPSSRFVDTEVASYGMKVVYKFGARGDQPPLTMTWWDGDQALPDFPGIDPTDPRQRLGDGNGGLLLVGEKGYITCGGWAGTPRLLPAELNRSYVRPAPTLPRVPEQNHHADWLSACKGGKPASAAFDYSARLTEVVLLGNVATRCGRPIEWDGPNMKVKGVPEADILLHGEYRAGREVKA